MNKAVVNRQMRQLHLWLGVTIGLQVGIWLLSGLFMTWFPIEEVRGENLNSEPTLHSFTNLSELPAIGTITEDIDFVPQTIQLKYLSDRAVLYLEGQDKKLLLDAYTGEALSPISEEWARKIATAQYTGGGTIIDAVLYNDPPREYARPGPVWAVQFDRPQQVKFYIDATTGELRAVRTRLWRVFDFMWGLHIMDWSTRENFNSWWIKMTAALAVILFLAGLTIGIIRLSGMVERSRRNG